MVSMSALHSLTAELHAGFLTLAFVCIIAVAAAQIVVRFRSKLPEGLVNLAIKARGYMEAAGYVGVALGLIGLLLSALTGMYAWPQDILLESSVVKNKITLTVYATVLWGGVLFIRMRFGRGVWTCPAMATVYVALAILAFGTLGMTGSLGAHLTVGESVLDPFWELVGTDVAEDLVLQPSIAMGAAIASVIALLGAMIAASRLDLFGVKLTPETCQKFLKWDEPTIHD